MKKVFSLKILFLMILAGLNGCGGGNGKVSESQTGASSLSSISNILAAPVISVAKTIVDPLELIEINVKGVDLTKNTFAIQVDVTGKSTYNMNETIEIRGLTSSNGLVFSAPILQTLALSTLKVGNQFSMRVIINNATYSNTISFTENFVIIPVTMRGIPSATFEMILKGLMASSNDQILKTSAQSLKPGQLADNIKTLDGDIGIADIQATVLFKQLIGADILRKPVVTSDGKQKLFGLPDSEALVNTALDCVKKAFSSQATGSSYESSSEDCFESTAIPAVATWVDQLSSLKGNMASAAEMISSSAGLGIVNISGNYVQRITTSSTLTAYINEFAQLAFRAYSGKSSGELFEYSLGRADFLGGEAMYDEFVSKSLLLKNSSKLLKLITGESPYDRTIAWGSKKFDALNSLESALNQFDELKNNLLQNPKEYNGTAFSDPQIFVDNALGGSYLIPSLIGDEPLKQYYSLQSAGCLNMPKLWHYEPAKNCSDINLFGSGTMVTLCESPISIGEVDTSDTECQALQTAYQDNKFYDQTASQISEIKRIRALAPSWCFVDPVPDVSSAICAQYYDAMSIIANQIIALANNKSTNGRSTKCAQGYSSFDTTPETKACIYTELISKTNSCPPGSRVPNWNVGSTSVCVYYSRDYVREGSCLTNYSLIDFLGAPRCRWSTLASDKPAAYLINTVTGNTSFLEK